MNRLWDSEHWAFQFWSADARLYLENHTIVTVQFN